MIKSMTSFGRASGIVDGKDILVEIKSVNNRYLDCNVKTPRMFSFLEEKIKAYVQTKGVARGKVDVFLGVDVIENLDTDILIDKAYAKKYIDALRELLTEFELKDDISVMTVAQNREIFSIKKPEEDIEKDWLSVKGILDVALDMFLEARAFRWLGCPVF